MNKPKEFDFAEALSSWSFPGGREGYTFFTNFERSPDLDDGVLKSAELTSLILAVTTTHLNEKPFDDFSIGTHSVRVYDAKEFRIYGGYSGKVFVAEVRPRLKGWERLTFLVSEQTNNTICQIRARGHCSALN